MQMKRTLLKLEWQKLPIRKSFRMLAFMPMFFSFLTSFSNLKADNDSKQITNLKATFIVNVLNYVRWQESDISPEDLQMELLVVGNDEHNIRDRLEYILHETQFKVNECRLKVRSFSSLEDANEQIEKKGAKIVLLLDSISGVWSKEKYPQISGTLILGESRNFLRNGCVITLRKENNRFKLGVNLKKAKKMNLVISSSLLGLNRVVLEE